MGVVLNKFVQRDVVHLSTILCLLRSLITNNRFPMIVLRPGVPAILFQPEISDVGLQSGSNVGIVFSPYLKHGC